MRVGNMPETDKSSLRALFRVYGLNPEKQYFWDRNGFYSKYMVERELRLR